MSQFFSEVPEEKKEKKYTQKEEISSEEETKTTKKESKLTQLKLELLEAQDNPTNKTVEKALRTIQKNQKLLENNPPFLSKFFDSVQGAKKVSKSVKEKSREIYTKMHETVKIEIKKEKKIVNLQDELLQIINLKNTNEKIKKLEELNPANPTEKFKILLTKVLVCLQNKYFITLITDFKEMKELYKEESLIFNGHNLKKLFLDQFIMYFTFLMNYKEEILFYELCDLLKELNEEIVEKKKTEFDFFVKKDFKETAIFDFQLLFFIKNNKLKEAIDFYEGNKTNFDLENEIIRNSLVEFGKECFINHNYLVSFSVFQDLYYFDPKLVEEELLMVNCVVIPSKLKEQKFFEHFLNLFVQYENEFLLDSCKKRNQIFKSFFYKENGNFLEAEGILESIGYKVVLEKEGALIK